MGLICETLPGFPDRRLLKYLVPAVAMIAYLLWSLSIGILKNRDHAGFGYFGFYVSRFARLPVRFQVPNIEFQVTSIRSSSINDLVPNGTKL